MILPNIFETTCHKLSCHWVSANPLKNPMLMQFPRPESKMTRCGQLDLFSCPSLLKNLVGGYGWPSNNRGGFTPQIINFNRVFDYFYHPFCFFSPYFWKHPYWKQRNLLFSNVFSLYFRCFICETVNEFPF